VNKVLLQQLSAALSGLLALRTPVVQSGLMEEEKFISTHPLSTVTQKYSSTRFLSSLKRFVKFLQNFVKFSF
jgi:hypothetical protein